MTEMDKKQVDGSESKGEPTKESPSVEPSAGGSGGLLAYILGDTPTGVRESIEAQERGWIATIKNTIIRIFRFVGIDRILSILGLPMLTSSSQDSNKEDEHSNKRKHNQLDQDEGNEDSGQIEKEAKKWRPDSAYVSIQLFIRKMFGSPDPNGNLDREENSDNQINEQDPSSEEPARNWNLKPDCHFIEGEEEDVPPFSSPNKSSCDENLNEFVEVSS